MCVCVKENTLHHLCCRVNGTKTPQYVIEHTGTRQPRVTSHTNSKTLSLLKPRYVTSHISTRHVTHLHASCHALKPPCSVASIAPQTLFSVPLPRTLSHETMLPPIKKRCASCSHSYSEPSLTNSPIYHNNAQPNTTPAKARGTRGRARAL